MPNVRPACTYWMISGGCVVISFIVAVFIKPPSAIQSPLLYQWSQFEAHMTDFHDYKVFYKDMVGNVRNDETVVLLHGFPTSSFDFYLMTNALKNTFCRIVLIDFLGFGYSDKPSNHVYSIMEQANLTQSILSKLGIHQIHILAHDYGATVTQELLARNLNRDDKFEIRSVGFLNAGLFPEVHRMTWSQYFMRWRLLGPFLIRIFASEWIFGFNLNGLFGTQNKLEQYDLNNHFYLAVFNDGHRRWTSVLSYIDERIEHETRWVNALQRTNVPLCMFYGAEDPVNPSPAFPDMYRSLVPNPCLKIFPKVGHYPHLEDPILLMSNYTAFLKERASMHIDDDLIRVVVPDRLPKPEPHS